MKRIILLSLLFSIISLCAKAQRGNNLLGIGLEAGFPTGSFTNYNTGLGFYGKGMLGVGTNGQVTLTTGYTFFRWKGSTSDYKIKTNIIPILVGYRYNSGTLFIEPMVGYSIFDTKTKSLSGGTTTKTKVSQSGFATGLAAGVRFKAIHVQAKYQVGFPSGSIAYFGVGISYNLSLRKAN